MVNKLLFLKGMFFTFIIVFSPAIASPQVTFVKTSDDQQIRLATWPAKRMQPTSKKIPMILILPGMGEVLERLEEPARYLSQKGFTTVVMDWRGQGGSSRNTQVESLCHVPDFQLYLEDLKTVLAQLPARQKIIILANSMGGHLAIRYVQEYGVDPRLRGMVLTAPMIKIKTRAYPWAIARAISWTMNKLGQSESFVLGYKPFSPELCEFKSAEHGCRDYFEKNCRILVAHPELAVGGPSFGWLEASFHSANQLEDPEKIAHVTVPVLIISALLDHRVENSAQKILCQQLPQCRLIDYESHHNIWGESQDLRTQFWRDFESFLAHIEGSPSSNDARSG